MQNYLVVIQGKVTGPYSIAELEKLHISAQTFVKSKEMSEFEEAYTVPELCMLFGLSAPTALPQYFASFDQRLMASAIDLFLVLLFYVFVMFVCSFFIPDKEAKIQFYLLSSPGIFIFKWLYSLIADAGVRQGSLGKQILKIRVVTTEGKRITLACSLLRSLCKIFSMLPFFLGYIYCFFNAKSQCLHDTLANTLVIKDRLT